MPQKEGLIDKVGSLGISVGDAEKTFNLSKPYLENIYKTIDDAKEQEEKAQQIVKQLNNQKDRAITE